MRYVCHQYLQHVLTINDKNLNSEIETQYDHTDEESEEWLSTIRISILRLKLLNIGPVIDAPCNYQR